MGICPSSALETLHKLAYQVSPGKFNMVGKRTLKLLFLLLGNSSVGSLMRVIRNSFIVLASLFSKSNCYTLCKTVFYTIDSKSNIHCPGSHGQVFPEYWNERCDCIAPR